MGGLLRDFWRHPSARGRSRAPLCTFLRLLLLLLPPSPGLVLCRLPQPLPEARPEPAPGGRQRVHVQDLVDLPEGQHPERVLRGHAPGPSRTPAPRVYLRRGGDAVGKGKPGLHGGVGGWKGIPGDPHPILLLGSDSESTGYSLLKCHTRGDPGDSGS